MRSPPEKFRERELVAKSIFSNMFAFFWRGGMMNRPTIAKLMRLVVKLGWSLNANFAKIRGFLLEKFQFFGRNLRKNR